MKIQESTVQLTASHEASRTQTLEIDSQIGFRQLLNKLAVDSEDDQAAALQRVQMLLQSLLDAIMAALDGKKCEENFAASDVVPVELGKAEAAAGGDREISWQRNIKETVCESEKTTVCGKGKVMTADGRAIEFQYALAMEREFSSEKSLQESGVIKLKDPLMLSFTGKACELTKECIKFDLNADGTLEEIPGLGAGTGFLVLDRNGNGKVDDGSELFGVASGNGFADLARLDADRNGWIDESDPAYQQLAVWSGEGFSSLTQRGVGALSTATVHAPFSLKTSANELLGQIRDVGFYLTEAGEVGHLQQVDLAVSDSPAGQKHPDQRQELAA
jgi:hypothetical protein